MASVALSTGATVRAARSLLGVRAPRNLLGVQAPKNLLGVQAASLVSQVEHQVQVPTRTWNEKPRRPLLNGQLHEAVEHLDLVVQEGGHVNVSRLYEALRRCISEKDLALGMRIHALILRNGNESNTFLANHIIRMYASHGMVQDANRVFDKVTIRDTFLWCSIIQANAQNGQPGQAIELYQQMCETDVKPNGHVYLAVLKACALASDLCSGKQVHSDIQECSLDSDVFIGTCLIDMYSKCGSLVDARKVFDELATKTLITWTAMIAGYARQGFGHEALALYTSMQAEGMTPADHVTFVCLLQACASVGALQQGKQLHAQIRERGLEANMVIGNSLVNMYAKCGKLEDARKVFDRLVKRDTVTWTAMIQGYTQHGFGREALNFYAEDRMPQPDRVTIMCLLQACASVGALQQGKRLHALVEEKGLETDVRVGNSLVDMYAKCGSLKQACGVFERLPQKDVITWTALLNGYAEHGDAYTAIHCFEQMLQQGMKPNGATLTCLLVACSHVGLVDEGQRFFKMMSEDYGIVPTVHHFVCMVDLFGRSGNLDEAEHMLHTMPFESEVAWRSLLSACNTHRDVERGKRCFDQLIRLAPESATAYVLLAHIYAKARRWADVGNIESLRKRAGAKKKPGSACIEVDYKVHEFTVGEERAHISSKMAGVNRNLKEGGHVPHTDLILRVMLETEKQDALCGHAEKLALAYGMLNTPEGTTLLVTKNLRMCDDCHSTTKILSRLEKRDIVVRDAHRVHRFVDGACSCQDRP